MKPLIFAACDTKYYNLYAAALRNSAAEHGMDCKVVCGGNIEPGPSTCLRYLLLPDELGRHESILVVDVDSIIKQPIDIPEHFDLGFFLRPDFQDNRKKVMGSVFYINARAIDFAWDLRKKLKTDNRWFDDQYWLWKLYQRNIGKYKVKFFGTDFINWHCDPAAIWTGKGDVKTGNEKFLSQLKRYS